MFKENKLLTEKNKGKKILASFEFEPGKVEIR